MPIKKICPVCDKEFEAKKYSQKCCGDKCRIKNWRSGKKKDAPIVPMTIAPPKQRRIRPAKTKPCKICKTLFSPSRKFRYCCSEKCREKNAEEAYKKKVEYARNRYDPNDDREIPLNPRYKKRYDKICIICKEPFQTHIFQIKTCSKACRHEAKLRTNKESLQRRLETGQEFLPCNKQKRDHCMRGKTQCRNYLIVCLKDDWTPLCKDGSEYTYPDEFVSEDPKQSIRRAVNGSLGC